MIWVLRIGYCFDQIFITRDAATIFWRAGASSVGAARILLPIGGRRDSLDSHLMFPAIAKVIKIKKPTSLPGSDLSHDDVAIIFRRFAKPTVLTGADSPLAN